MKIIGLIIDSYRYCMESKESEFNSFVGMLGFFSFFLGILFTLFILMLIDNNRFFMPFLIIYIPLIFLCILPICIYVDFLKKSEKNNNNISKVEYVKVLDTVDDEISVMKLDDYIKITQKYPEMEKFYKFLYKCDAFGKDIKKG